MSIDIGEGLNAMTLTLTPEKEARLVAQAHAAGMTLDDYAQNVIDLAAVPLQFETPEHLSLHMDDGRTTFV